MQLLLDQSIQDDLRAHARHGAKVADLVRVIRKRAGVDSPGEGRFLVSAYLTKTFDIPLSRATEVSGWVGFEDDDGETTDEELESLLGEFIHRG